MRINADCYGDENDDRSGGWWGQDKSAAAVVLRPKIDKNNMNGNLLFNSSTAADDDCATTVIKLSFYFLSHPPFLLLVQVKDICNELDVRSLCHKILQNVSMLLNADRGSLFLVQGRTAAAAGGDGPKR